MLLDDGCNCHIISDKVGDKIGLDTVNQDLSLLVLGNLTEGNRRIGDVTLVGTNGFALHLREGVFGQILDPAKHEVATQDDIKDLDYCAGVTFEDFPDDGEEVDDRIGIILGSEHAWTWEEGERRTGPKHLPIAVESKFGWCLTGPRATPSSERTPLCCHKVTKNHTLDPVVSELLAKHFEPVDEGATALSVEDKFALKQMEETVIWDPVARRWRVGLPWKRGRADAARILNSLPSDQMSLDRLRRSAFKMQKDPARKEIIFQQMQEFDDNGQVVDVDPEEHRNMPPDRPKWVVPLHIVDKPGKPGQVRVCHDCKAKCGGVCLNDFLLDGPPLACSVIGILMRFREGGEVAVGADIKGYFHDVFIIEEDQGVFRYWWYKDRTMTEISLKMFLGHLMGAKSSSFTTTFVLRHHVSVHRDRYSLEVVDAVNRDFYVDDLLKSLKSVAAARDFRLEITGALADGGFKLCKWRSTHPEVLLDQPTSSSSSASPSAPSDAPDVDDLTPTEDLIEKVLGMRYRFSRDEFSYETDPAKVGVPVATKRGVLSVMNRLYDPLGLLSPFSIIARKIFQRAVKAVASWSDEDLLPPDIVKDFQSWQALIPQLADFRIRRWYSTPDTQVADPELHVFSDASSEAYGIVAYRREVVGDRYHVAIAFAKAHVVPIKFAEAGHHESIPRLELQAARLAAEIRAMIERETHKYSLVTMWTDSECVLKQLRDNTTRFKMYFANRISKIHAMTSVSEWRHVPSDLNPADDCSRGIIPSDPKWDRFLHGPGFLWGPESAWPVTKLSPAPLPASIFAINFQPPRSRHRFWPLNIAESTSSWVLKRRRVAVVMRMLKELVIWRREGKPKRPVVWFRFRFSCFSLADVNSAESMLVSAIQWHGFTDELKQIVRKEIAGPDERVELTSRPSPLKDLNPFVDDLGLLRCGGRLQNAHDLSYDEKFPLLLPAADPSVVDLIRHYHEELLHAGVDQVLAELRRRFWIPKCRQVIKRVVHLCVRCQELFKQPQSQKMAALPEYRITKSAPFLHTGVDVFGPFKVKIAGRSYHKVWVCLFTCLSIRAVHFEVLRDMSSNCFINALIRFRSRRPGVRHLYSDNGSNFTAANKELASTLEEWNSAVSEGLRISGLDWSFLPPVAPHRGGVWERLVRSAKRHLADLMGEEDLHIEVFSTVLAKAEAVLNSRPLTYVSGASDGEHPLTPLHFLCPGVFVASDDEILPPSPPDAFTLTYSWKRVQQLIDAFWRRWLRDYVSALQARPKWRETEVDLKIGDVVLMVDDNIRRSSWRLARVMDTSGSDNHVRGVTVKTPDGKLFLRDRTKFVHMELDPMRVKA